jgi:hypothetical protein
MLTLTDTMVELADCHTTLYYLEAPQPGPLPLGTSASYNQLYATVGAPARVTYDAVAGHAGVLLEKLRPFFKKNNYWNRFFASGQITAYPNFAWDFALPILCSLKARINFIANAKFKFQVRPLPSVLLYPFGWSARLSLRLLGPHSVDDLAAFNQHIFDNKAFHIDPDPAPVPGGGPSTFSLPEVFDHIADAVRIDAFGGLKTKDFGPNDPVIVTTVLAKKGGTLKPGGLGNAQQKVLLRIVKPDGPPLTGKIQDYLHELDPNVKYVVMDNYGRFIWMEDLLNPVDRNYQHLRCYHNNTFNSLVQARHLFQLLTQAAMLKALPPPVAELTDKAVAALATPSLFYENASLRQFLRDPAVSDARNKMAKFNPKPAGP